MNTKHTIIQGDSRQMSELQDKSVHLIITSPPYWQLKDYGTDRQNGKATEFLREKLKGKRVFLRHDEVKHDSENHLLAYLYLENKTFVNAHLLKEGLAEVDENMEFKYKEKFKI